MAKEVEVPENVTRS